MTDGRNLNILQSGRQMLRAFGGVNETYGCSEAELSSSLNFSGRGYPALQTRATRKKVREVQDVNGMYHLNGLVICRGTTLEYTPDADESRAGAVVLENALTDNEKAMTGMGTKVLIWPDKKAFDTVSGELTDLAAAWTLSGGTMIVTPCDGEGRTYAPDMVVLMGRDESIRIPCEQDEYFAGNVDTVNWHQWQKNGIVFAEFMLNKVPDSICCGQELGVYQMEDHRGFKRLRPEQIGAVLERKLLYAFGNWVQWQWKNDPYLPEVSENTLGICRADGTETPYLPVYQDGTKDLIGAMRDTSYAANTATAAWLPGAADSVTLLGAANTRMAWVHRADEPVTVQEDTGGAAPAAEETPVPADPTPEPTPEITPEPTPEATPAPTEAPTQTPAETQTPAPTAAPTEAPTAAPTQAPTQVPDPTAGWPDNIAVQELANYGFAVTSATTTIYEYTGWQDIDDATYYYDPSTHQPVTGQQVIQGNVYTFAADGALNRTARGIDVSKFQGSIDWNAVKSDGITFAIIRCGYRGYGSGALVEDSTYRRNIQGAINAGLRVGVYFYSQAINEAEAVEEASMVLSLVSGYSLPLGVYYDTESVGGGRANALSAAERTACAVAFCETIRSAGYSAGVYSYASWFYNALNFANISKYNIWIAQYRDTLSFSYKHNIWQYTGSGSVKGISKPVDMNIG